MSAPIKFNREDVIEKAKNLYWEKGYHATSMRNLQDVINMHPGSIYAAFGSKDKLFIESLNRYAADDAKRLADCMEQKDTVLDGLKHFIHTVIVVNKATAPSGMCMIVKTIAELTQNDSPELLAHATEILEEIEASFATLFAQAIDSGEISAEKNPIELARYLQIQIIGLRTYDQITSDDAAVEKYIDDIFKNIV
ncbi:MAG: TetR/AcrR family transcriptional regulator [Psychrobacter sp.]|uniref:TetR/AcrR family transcriptional regulator n=1 Tax=Psychrobacter sp. TaxID=56811 RepID=UPI002648365F|nr:TetR/AcrR family transcriptional regulator [Psychrobacter sp.]MDN5620740.1 TetR/AcrR family transcriptional regulator [Psychrobacter sp.]